MTDAPDEVFVSRMFQEDDEEGELIAFPTKPQWSTTRYLRATPALLALVEAAETLLATSRQIPVVIDMDTPETFFTELALGSRQELVSKALAYARERNAK